jgi:DNA invertase Pin-like site-specific DNA recombinase
MKDLSQQEADVANQHSNTHSDETPIERNPHRVALYARVSTSNGHQDPELQLRELREYATRRGWDVTEEYIDADVSGSKDSRPALNRLMADVYQRRCDTVLVWKLDRFGRSLRHLVNALAEIEALGVAFISLRDNLDLSTPSGRLMFQIIGAMAEFERALIQERVKAGLRNARAKGKRLGRPRYFVSASRIAALRDSGASWRAVSRELGVGLATVHRASSVISLDSLTVPKAPTNAEVATY